MTQHTLAHARSMHDPYETPTPWPWISRGVSLVLIAPGGLLLLFAIGLVFESVHFMNTSTQADWMGNLHATILLFIGAGMGAIGAGLVGLSLMVFGSSLVDRGAVGVVPMAIGAVFLAIAACGAPVVALLIF